MAIDYKQAGVDVEAGDALVDWLKSQAPTRWPHQERLVSGIGGFAALFKAGFPEMTDPCLVTCTDGVGTKVKLATELNSYQEVAQDLVAMCVNDLICTGGQPLLFLDYYACGKLELEPAKEFLASLQKACVEAQCVLIGGETAEMPGVYKQGDFDCAGFAVGIVDKPKAWGAHKVKVGDQLLALASSGCHSNGYSLVRKLFAEDLKAWGKKLLTPTTLYVKAVRELASKIEIHALANITGGGMDNIPRVLPQGTQAQLKNWEWTELFKEIQKRSGLGRMEMLKTLNCGVGMVMVLPASEVETAQKELSLQGISSFSIGEVVSSEVVSGEIISGNGEPDWSLLP